MQRFSIGAAACGICCWALTMAQAGEPEVASPVGKQIGDFTLRDARGKEFSLSQFSDQKLLVVAFLGTECPLARIYAPRLQALSDEFSAQSVTFLGINSNCQDSNTEVAQYVREAGLAFPVLKDPGSTVADQFGAMRTPEVFVLDATRVVRYWGRIDDQYEIGIKRQQPSHQDLRAAVTELLAGQTVSLPSAPAVGCRIGRSPRNKPTGSVTYSQHVAVLLDQKCVKCHRPGEVAPFPLTDYAEVVGWAETIREVVDNGRMPPWLANPEHGKFANDARLSDDEKQLIRDWIEGGCAQGDPALRPPLPEFAEGWQIPQPDQVIYIQDEPVTVPAEGVVQYQYYTVDPGFTEDVWISQAEARPDNRAVVHHLVVWFQAPGERRSGPRGTLIGFAPGMPPNRFPAGSAMLVKAGSKMVFQVHYTPNGTEQQDRSSVGLKFVDASEVTRRVGGGPVPNMQFAIPPGDGNFEVRSSKIFWKDAILLTLTPHMHLRGKSFRYELQYLDGSKEILLDVPRFDFNWQLRYELAEPKLIPKGSRMICTAYFDNSASNPANPDPTQEVRWGDQTWEEMMIGYYSTIPVEDGAEAQMDGWD